jgi:S1-C subfamily serine protease
MRGDLLDLLLAAVMVVCAVSGVRRGFIVGVVSMAGFVGGTAVGLIAAPVIVRSVVSGRGAQFVLAITVVFVAAMIGQAGGFAAGVAFRNRVRWRPMAVADSPCGATVSALSVLVVAWLVGTAAGATYPGIATQVSQSMVLRAVNRAMPQTAQRWFSGFRVGLVNGPFPEVVTGAGMAPVKPPDAAVVASRGVRAAAASVVKVIGVAPRCSLVVHGSGFVFAPNHVMTNAHVVAGVREPVVADRSGRRWHAQVVLYDPAADIAVLYVRGLGLHQLPFATSTAHTGDDAVVAGYPGGGRFTAAPARVGQTLAAKVRDTSHSREVIRQIYTVRADVQHGDSGGPLLTSGGHVAGVIFAASGTDPGIGYALTTAQVKPDAHTATQAVNEVSTQNCR